MYLRGPCEKDYHDHIRIVIRIFSGSPSTFIVAGGYIKKSMRFSLNLWVLLGLLYAQKYI